MDWIHRRRGLESKQGWRGQTLASISTPPLHLLAVFAIVILLLSFSHHADYKAQLQRNTQFLSFLLPFILVFLVGHLLMSGGFYYFLHSRSGHGPIHRSPAAAAEAAASFPWGVAALVVVVLVLLSYQSAFHSKWFGPLSS
ncbi:hypothetical protein Ancab_028018 [Ancistrocladus abbreviatus]